MENSAFFLLPSEIARLVYAQLKIMNCHAIADKFLHMSPHLEECRKLHKENGTFWTQAHGLSLKEICDQYLNAKDLILETVRNTSGGNYTFEDPVVAFSFLLELSEQKNSKKNTDSEVTTEKIKDIDNNEACGIASSEVNLPENVSIEGSNSIVGNNINSSDFNPYLKIERISKRISRKPARYDNFIVPKKVQTRYMNNSCESLENTKMYNQRKVRILKPKKKFCEKIITQQVDSSKENCEPLQVVINSCELNPLKKIMNDGYELKTSVIDDENSKVTSIQSSSNISKRTSLRLRSSTTLKSQAPVIAMDSEKMKNQRKTRKNLGKSAVVLESKSNTSPEIETANISQIQRMLIDDSKWHDLIAENINKKLLVTPQKKIETCTDNSDVIESIVEETLSEELCDEFIRNLLSCNRNITQENEDLEENYENDIYCDTIVPEKLDQCLEIANNSHHQRLDDMNEFIRFDSESSDKLTLQLDVIQQDMQNSSTSDDHVENNEHFSYVVCTSDTASVGKHTGNIDDVINLYSETKSELEWDANSVMMLVPVVSSDIPVIIRNDQNCKAELHVESLLPSQEIHQNRYRRIAPKPELRENLHKNITAVCLKNKTKNK